MSTTKTKYRDDAHPGVNFDLTTAETAELLGWSIDRVRNHAESLGGVRKKWGDGFKRPASWRFPSKGIKKRGKEIAAQMQANQKNRSKAPVA